MIYPTRHDLQALRALYKEAGQALDGWSCEGSTDCCRFDETGREPYLWPNEWALVAVAIAARGGAPRRRAGLPLAGACPLLSAEGRCTIYEDRPFGCRTYFCERAEGPTRRPPRSVLAEIGRRVAALAERAEPMARPRALTAYLSKRADSRCARSPLT